MSVKIVPLYALLDGISGETYSCRFCPQIAKIAAHFFDGSFSRTSTPWKFKQHSKLQLLSLLSLYVEPLVQESFGVES